MKLLFPFYCLFVSIVLIGCSSIQGPEVKSIQNAQLNRLNPRSLDFQMDLELFNKNENSIQVESANLKALVDNIELDAVEQKYDTKMLGKSNFLLPINVSLSLKKLAEQDGSDIMSKGLRIYNSGQIDLTLDGHITLSDGRGSQTVPITHTQKVYFKKNLK